MFVEAGQLGDDLTELLLAASEEANERVAPDTELLLARLNEASGVARPAARIVKRHMPAGFGGTGNPDADDAVSAAIVLFRYVWRQLRLWRALRRERDAGVDPNARDAEPVVVTHVPADPLASV